MPNESYDGTLFDLLYYKPFDNYAKPERKQHLTEKQKLVLAIKCLEAVKSLHDNLDIHRNLSPENITVHIIKGESLNDIMTVSFTDPLFNHVDSQLSKTNPIQFGVLHREQTNVYTANEVYTKGGGVLCRGNDIYSLGKIFRDDLEIGKMLCKDLRQEGDFIEDRMIAEEHLHRADAEICLSRFQNELKALLKKDCERLGFSKKELAQEVENEYKELLSPDDKLNPKLNEQEATPEEIFNHFLKNLAKTDSVLNQYDNKTTGSRSERKLFHRAIFKSDERNWQISAIDCFIQQLNGNAKMEAPQKAELLRSLAICVSTQIRDPRGNSRLVSVMNDLVKEINKLNILQKKEGQNISKKNTDLLSDYLKEIKNSDLSDKEKKALTKLADMINSASSPSRKRRWRPF